MQAPRTRVLKEWGAPLSPGEDEEFVLDSLEEFIHLKLETLCPRSARKRSASPVSRADLHGTPSQEIPRCNVSSTTESALEPPTKRPRYDVTCMSNLIPQVSWIYSV